MTAFVSEETLAVMAALELALDVAVTRGPSREVAILDEAWTLAGYCPFAWADTVYLSSRVDAVRVAAESRARRNRRSLQERAQGVLLAFETLAEAGALTYRDATEARRLLWVQARDAATSSTGALG